MTDVYLALGHGIRPDGTYDPGAVGADGRTEQQEIADVARVTIDALRRSGVSLDHEPLDGTDPNYAGSINAVNRGEYRCAVSIHFDYRLAPRGGFGIYVSDQGRKLSLAIAQGYRDRDLPLRYGGAYEDTRGLWFVHRTRPPAVIWECDRIADYGPSHSVAVGESIAQGVCSYLGRNYVGTTGAAEPSTTPTLDVAVAAQREPDATYASVLGAAHGFAVVRPDGSRWRVVRAARHAPDTVVEVGYLVAVGYGADALVQQVGDGHAVTGSNRAATELAVVDLVRATEVDRQRPWATA